MTFIQKLTIILCMALLWKEDKSKKLPLHNDLASLSPLATTQGENIVEINVRGERWNLFLADPDWEEVMVKDNSLGVTICDAKAIVIRSGQNYFSERETIWHELLHAGVCQPDGSVKNDYYNSSNEGSHAGIDLIATYTFTILHDNPELGRYLIGQ